MRFGMKRAAGILVAMMIIIAAPFAGCVLPTSECGGQEEGGVGGDEEQTTTYYSTAENVNNRNKKYTEEFPVDKTGDLDIDVGVNCSYGSLTIKVMNPSGTAVYERTFSGPGQFADSRTVSGEKGTWRIEYDYHYFTGQIVLEITQ